MPRFATVNNWPKFQHYNNRRPPWIKLHRDILDKPEFMALTPASRSLLMLLWLLASEADTPGRVRIDLPYLFFRLRTNVKESDLQPLLGEFITEDASNMLADCSQLATPEGEGEGEESEREIPPLVSTQGPPRGAESSPSNGNGNGHHKRQRFIKPTLEEVEAFIAEAGYNVDAEAWYAHYEANGWRVGKNPMVRWKAAVHTWQRQRESGGMG